MSIARLLHHQVTIERDKTRVADGVGGYHVTEVAATVASARISPLSSRDQLAYLQQQYAVTHKVYFLGSTDVRAGDRLRFGDRTFAVHGVLNPSEAGRHREALCEETVSA